jgi:hypothetical protein
LFDSIFLGQMEAITRWSLTIPIQIIDGQHREMTFDKFCL